ncbi:MAG: hypothetical protein JWN57_1100, partial [Frankiales bacterium]|nr:hypothetical protein [Frankiales bacterium]
MSVEPPLSRRIEELAAYDEPEPRAADLEGTVGALRGDLSAVRAEIGSLRGELGAVRTDLDGLGGRLSGSVAASRTETSSLVRRVAELAGRFDLLGGRLDEVRAELPGLAREVREGLELLPVRTGSQLDDVVGRVADRVGVRIDTMGADVRRTVTSALESDARTATNAQAALVEARGALESRLALLEDTLDGLNERIESLAREGATTTTERLADVAAGVKGLETRLATLVDEQAGAAVRRMQEHNDRRLDDLAGRLTTEVQGRADDLRSELVEGLARSRGEQETTRTAVAEMAGDVRSALATITETVHARLGALTASVTEALEAERQRSRTQAEQLAERLEEALTAFQDDQRRRAQSDADRVEGLLQALDGRVEGVRSSMSAGLTDLRADVATEIGVLRPQLEDLAQAGVAAQAAAAQGRAELVAALEALRERMAAAHAAATEAVRAAVLETRDEVVSSGQTLREALLDRMQEQHTALVERLGEVGLQLTADTAATRETGERVAGLAAASEDVRRA